MARETGEKLIVDNRKARHEYQLLERYEAGIVLTGTEVKSLRQGNVSIKEAYGLVRNGEVWLEGMHITPYEQGNRYNHEPVRSRKLLMHRREIQRLIGAVEQKGLALVPLEVYFSDRGQAKIALALGRGKRSHDRRGRTPRRHHRPRRPDPSFPRALTGSVRRQMPGHRGPASRPHRRASG